MALPQLEESRYARRFQILFALMFGIILTPIDGSMVNVILPTLTDVFSAQIAIAQWVPMIYLLIISSLVLFFGRLGDIWGYKKVFQCGLVVFVTGSALCGLSHSMYELIVFRALQAVGAAMLMAVPLAIITACFPANELGKALGTFSVSIAAGLAIGPSFGGFIASLLGWRFTFLINVPLGIAAFFIIHRVMPEIKGQSGKYDFLGAVTAFGFLFCLLLFVNRAQGSGINVANETLVIVSLASGIGFFLIERYAADPMLRLNLFRNITFTFASISSLLNFMAQFVVIFLTPFYLHRVLHYAPNRIGLIMTAFPLAVMVAGPFSGWLSDRIGSRGLSCAGQLICAAAMLLLSRLPASAEALDVALRLALFGAGAGVFQSPNTSAAMSSVPRPHLGVASSVLANVRNIGMVVGIALAGVILHAVVPEAILLKESLNASQAASFLHGTESAFRVGAEIAVVAAVTALIKGRRNVQTPSGDGIQQEQ
ncbi:MAG: MFS transporter [Deltaproteobacteria bacterium]